MTKRQYNKLVELKKQAEKLQKEQDKIVAQAEKITGDIDGNWTYDWLLNDYGDVDLLLYHLNLEVKP